jgi:glutamate/tyrosine decarboxylase-like PLP-dependent enzyme
VALKHPRRPARATGDIFTEAGRIPRHELASGEIDPDVAYQLVHDELMLDGNARLNLATFVGTWMEPQAQRLMAETFDKNMIDKDEYPQTAELEMRCVSILSGLWHAPDRDRTAGCSTTGSSEAAMLGGLALKRRWQQARRAAGKPADRPNIVMGINVQGCWDKFANYWEVEPRSRPGAQIVAQYYNFVRLGFDGYRRVQGFAREVATRLSSEIAKLGPFELITKGDELPVFAFRVADEVKNFTVFDVSHAVRERGWLVPAYTFPKNRGDLAALRVVVKRGFSHDVADLFLADLKRQLVRLERQPMPLHDEASAGSFHH